MRFIVKAWTFIFAIATIALVLLVFWFIFANYTYRYGLNGTISYMLRTMDAWWRAVVAFFLRLA